MPRSAKSQDLDGMLARRRMQGVAVRDLTDGSRPRTEGDRAFSSPLRWLAGIVGGVAFVAAVVGAVVAVPAIRDCHAQDAKGFFVGDTYGQCLGRGVSERAGRFDSGLRMMLLGSGR